MPNDSQVAPTTARSRLESGRSPGGASFSDVADLLDVAERLLRTEIALTDHSKCDGGDFDPCWCVSDLEEVVRHSAYVERLGRCLATANAIQVVVAGARLGADADDRRVAYLVDHPEADTRFD